MKIMYIFSAMCTEIQRDEISNDDKSITAREIFRECPQVKKKLWGGEFWTDGYFASTVGKHGDENMLSKYVKNQGKGYEKLHECYQYTFF